MRRNLCFAICVMTWVLLSTGFAQQSSSTSAPNVTATVDAGSATTPSDPVRRRPNPGSHGGSPCLNALNPVSLYVPVFGEDAVTLCNSQIFQTGLGPDASLGIGTDVPFEKLDVNGTIGSRESYWIGGTRVLSIGSSAAYGNLFLGKDAGANNTSGNENVFAGDNAGGSNTTGYGNTLIGGYAGSANTGGRQNTFVGYLAGAHNTAGLFNTFVGEESGHSNDTGSDNTFVGISAGESTTSGGANSFFGAGAGVSNTTGESNTAIGENAGKSNTTGSYNIFMGPLAGANNTTGSNNIMLGFEAGYSNLTGSFNLYLNGGRGGASDESHTIRIGTDGDQYSTFIGGIWNTLTQGGVPVYINNAGQLATQPSSLRFKEHIFDMGDSSSDVMKLRPVTFLYKPEYDEGERTLQYGLIAEEVAKVYPELVANDVDGKPYSVRYQYLTTMLLNEVQKQYHHASEQVEVIKAQEQKIEELEQRLFRLESLLGKPGVPASSPALGR